MQQEDKACFVQGGRELAKAAYKTGFDDGFNAAVNSLMTISDGLRSSWLSANAGRKPLSALGGIGSRCEQCPRWGKSSSLD